MPLIDNARISALALTILAGYATLVWAEGRPPLRKHTETEAATLQLVPARVKVRGADTEVRQAASGTTVRTNSLPDHTVGRFPNRSNPNRIAAIARTYQIPAASQAAARVGAKALSKRSYFGVALNGVPFDPGTAEVWQGNPRSGWHYEALGGAVPLGLDTNFAHVQPDGSYHYHGLPTGLLVELGWREDAASPLIGFAADGFPIYALTAAVNGQVRILTSSWQLKQGTRPGGSQPSGRYDGAFVEDYEYRAGSGDLDECNGMVVRTKEYPQGTYAYFLTETFPVVPRCLKGRADSSFDKRR